jgi:hypothetical protein
MPESRIRTRHKGSSPRRSSELKIRLTPDELNAVRARAAQAGQPMADFTRRRLLESGAEIVPVGRVTKPASDVDPAPPAADPALVRQVARIGNNLNQIARAIHRAALWGEPIDRLAIHLQLHGIEATLLQILPAQAGRG